MNGEPHEVGVIGGRALFNFTQDAAIIQVKAGWTARAWIYVTNGPGTGTAGTTEDQQYSVLGTGGSMVDMRMCAAGGSLGVSNCGVVQELGVAKFYEGQTVGGLGEVSFCGVKGDSGAPVFAGHIAYGIEVVGGATDICDSFYVGIRKAQNDLNVDVAIDGV